MSNIDWTLTRNDIFERALLQIGALADGASINDRQMRQCQQNINIATQELARFNLFVWNTLPYILTTVAGQNAYQIVSNDVVGIELATYTSPNNQRVPLRVRPYTDFLQFPNPNGQRGIGPDTSIHVDSVYATPTIYIYPTPDNVYPINMTLVRKLKDWDTAAGNDFPPWWVGTLVDMLAAKLAPEFGLPLADRARLDAKAADAVQQSRIDNFKNTNYDFTTDGETYERN